MKNFSYIYIYSMRKYNVMLKSLILRFEVLIHISKDGIR